MNSEDLKKITDSICEKIGSDNAGIIADDIGNLITQNESVNTKINDLESEITDLKSRNEKLISSNANLLKQVPVSKEVTSAMTSNKEEKIILKNQFDKYGNFIE